MNMAQHAKPSDHQSKQISQRRDKHPVPDFKPVALPALKAAIQAVRAQPRRPVRHDLPAILRKETEPS